MDGGWGWACVALGPQGPHHHARQVASIQRLVIGAKLHQLAVSVAISDTSWAGSSGASGRTGHTRAGSNGRLYADSWAHISRIPGVEYGAAELGRSAGGVVEVRQESRGQ